MSTSSHGPVHKSRQVASSSILAPFTARGFYQVAAVWGLLCLLPLAVLLATREPLQVGPGAGFFVILATLPLFASASRLVLGLMQRPVEEVRAERFLAAAELIAQIPFCLATLDWLSINGFGATFEPTVQLLATRGFAVVLVELALTLSLCPSAHRGRDLLLLGLAALVMMVFGTRFFQNLPPTALLGVRMAPLLLPLSGALLLLPRLHKAPSARLTGWWLSNLAALVGGLHLLLVGDHDFPHLAVAFALFAMSALVALLAQMLAALRERDQLREELRRGRALQVGLEAQIDERMRVEEELEGQRNLLEVTLSAIGEAIVTTDTHGRINFMNPTAERLTGWRLAEVYMCRLDQVFQLSDLEQREELHKPMKNVLNDDQAQGEGARLALLRVRNGTTIPIETSNAPIVSSKNLLIGSALVFRDISAQRKVALELAEARDRVLAASNSKSEFLASVSHEIRTPMNAILGMVDLLMETELSSEQIKYLKTFKGASESLLSLINDILDVSMMEAGPIHLDSHPFNLRDLIQVQVELFRTESHKKGLGLEYQIDPQVDNLMVGDAVRLGQILFNLISNAIKFTHHGQIELAVSRTFDDKVQFAISDSGIGISADKQQQIFEIFTQGDASTTRRYGGTGLGLAICRNLVRQMGGQIWVKSEVGRGSVFAFTAALAMGSRDHLNEWAAYDDENLPAEVQNDARPLSIMLVEDSPDNRLLINFYLKNTPYQITEAENGQLAVDAFKRGGGCYDLILMDIQMPVMDGYTAARLIRQHEQLHAWPACAITALTASVLDESIYKSYEAGCNAHLKKPIKKDTLLKAIYKHTAQQPARNSLESTSAKDLAYARQLELAEMIPTYLENRKRDLDTLEQALAQGNFDTVRILGHRMKGSGSSYGFPRITELGHELEQAARAQDLEKGQASLVRLKAYLKQLSILLERS